MYSIMKRSHERYRMRERGRLTRISWPMAWRRWVLPRPTPPQMKRGLYLGGSGLATARAAAWASWFDGPATKVSKLYLPLRCVGGVYSPCGGDGSDSAGTAWATTPSSGAAPPTA